ncbi:TIGR01777 family oxidoreductase [Mucilaginibacter sp.]|uniref:TIGR01777 family oxidoreductase n=1 Tax=Mucilaginibacter sp. TaxID=1882438 RepID=UPI00284443A5|nr:TIGR01777 family oxidoreductase [Mucilaginibacter sp.]MDR3693175.1 TIGR01777 family oxidoreductase [Mucilaginibacter sp.]
MNQISILLTGGTGLIGCSLTRQLLEKGYTVSHLSRSLGKDPRVKTFLWDVHKGEIEEHSIDGVDIIIHLAGAGIADGRWTAERKKEIIDSRTKSIQLIYGLLKTKKHQVKSIISASAIGYYSDRGEELMTEDSPPFTDFMAKCCVEWEAAVDEGKALGLQVTKFRTGVVLDKGGALAKMAAPVKLFVGAPLGSGRQWIPWIHVQDVIGMYLSAVENENFEGVYNMVAPNPVTNKQLTTAIAKQLHKPLWLPNVPAFLLKLLLGEMSTIVLGSTKVSAKKIEAAGYKFTYREVSSALKAIYG